MSIFARIQNNAVAEIVTIPDDADISTMFHPSLVFVPCDQSCREGMAYIGGVFSAPEPTPTAIPEAMGATARQIKLALYHDGLLDEADEFILAGPRDDQIEWEYQTEFLRNHPLIATIAANLELDSAAIDRLFSAASVL